MKVVAETLGVARSNLIDRLKEKTKPRRRYHKAQDAAVVPLITALAAQPPRTPTRIISATPPARPVPRIPVAGPEMAGLGVEGATAARKGGRLDGSGMAMSASTLMPGADRPEYRHPGPPLRLRQMGKRLAQPRPQDRQKALGRSR